MLPSSSGNIPVLSIFQAFMVKEIGEGFGLDINSLISGTNLLINNITKILSSKKSKKLDNQNNNNDLSDILDSKEINKVLDVIRNKVKNKLDKGNKESILSLANVLNEMREANIKKEIKTKELELINLDFTNDVYKICLEYFKKELNESEGLSFMVNYFNKCKSLLEDIDYYINKKDWGKYNIEIK